MGWLIFVLIIVAIATVIFNFKLAKISPSKKKNNSQQEFAYRPCEALFTPSEISFYRELDKAVGEKFTIFGKVRVADIIAPEKGLSKSNWRTAFNKISAKHFDFVLCNKNNLKVEAVIELDDKSHSQTKRMNRDKFLNRATQTAGLKFIRFPVKSSYSTTAIQSEILQILEQ